MKEKTGPLQFLLFCVISLKIVASLTVSNEIRRLNLEPTDNGIQLSAQIGDREVLTGFLWPSKNFSSIKCIGAPSCSIDSAILEVIVVNSGFKITWKSSDLSSVFQDCFDLKPDTHWFGGPQRKEQLWPLEKMTIDGSEPYVPKKSDNFAVCERYWLNSKGTFIFLSDSVPLFVDQKPNSKVCFKAQPIAPYIKRKRNILEYHLILKEDAKVAHLHAVNHFLGKPTGHPHDDMIASPIWTTWAKYKRNISDNDVLQFANEIRRHDIRGTQLEIDDNWEKCYGAQEFSEQKFGQIEETVKKLHDMGFRVTLWVHPFVDDDCQNNSKFGLDNGYFVKNEQGDTIGSWWNGNKTHQIDFTNSNASKWYTSRLTALKQKYGIDSFKFDAGETDYGPQPSNYEQINPETIPSALTSSYIRTVAEFGNLVEVRSAWRTQDLPIFVRMIDKDSNWDHNNGLKSLITTLFQMNMNGYPLVLPDMIGGNGYTDQPDAELLIRWAQANAFMPSMQFSFLPWDFKTVNNTIDIIKKAIRTHHTFMINEIRNAIDECIKKGTPVNPPIWWIDPNDEKALKCDDEFLLGENILVAPVLNKGQTSRNIYLPKGLWLDGTNPIYTAYKGPMELVNYSAPLDVVPNFRLLNNN